MADITHIADHSRRAILNLNGPFQGKPRIASFVWALVEELQEMEDAVASVITLRQVENSFLPQLQVLGKIVGERYRSQGLETYRAYVKARILVNRSGGTINDLLRVIEMLSTAIPVWWNEGGNQVCIILQNDPVVDLDGINRMLRDAKKGNEGLQLFHYSGTGLRFDRASPGTAATGGFGRASNSAVGGRLFRVRTK